jgi:transposase
MSVAKLALEHGVNTNLLFKWRREYRAGKYGAPDPVHLAEQATGELPTAASQPDSAVTLLPVQLSPAEGTTTAALPWIEVVFRRATVRICGSLAESSLQVVLDALVRRS